MAVGIGDDAAVVEPERNRLDVLSVDALVEGVHFDRAFTPPDAIGHRALAVNLSDLAAMGATPRLCLLSLVLPGGWPVADFEAMLDGLLAPLGTRTIVIPIGSHDNNQHSYNENLRLQNLWDGIELLAALLTI